jgi:anaerobic selenocysteine-containing dehydrogenase
VLAAVAGDGVLGYEDALRALGHGTGISGIGAVLLTGNYPTDWSTEALATALGGKFVVLIDTLDGPLVKRADVVLPGATWLEKAGTFENARGMIQAFERAIPTIEGAHAEGQIALDLLAALQPRGTASAGAFSAEAVRREMASNPALAIFGQVTRPETRLEAEPDMQVVEI